MALNIKNPAVERLAREVAAEAGETITEAVLGALKARLENMRRGRSLETVLAEVAELQEFVRAQPRRDTRSDEEILGYDQFGLPG